MNKGTRPLEAEAEMLRGLYAAINRGDIAAAVSVFDPEIVRVEPAGFPMSGTYRGLAAMTAHFEKARATWAEGSCEPERFVAGTDRRVIVLVQVRVRLKGETEWREGRLADVFTFGRDGKIVEFRTFGEVREGLEWAGAKASEAR